MAIESDVDRLEEEIRIWSPATHIVWGLWGVVISREDIIALFTEARKHVHERNGKLVYEPPKTDTEAHDAGESDSFDNMRYSLGRIELMRTELAALNMLT